MKIEHVSVRRLKLPLVVPYKLAIGTVTALDTIIVEVRSENGRSGYGEATLLKGYTDETVEQVWRDACVVAQNIAGRDLEHAGSVIRPLHARAPFTSSALMTAVEMLQGSALLEDLSGRRVPLLAVLNQMDGELLEQEIEQHLASGYETLKIKVGFDVATDLARVARIQRVVAGRARLRIDANQGYSREQGCRFVQGLAPDGIELVEQTCAAGDWDAAVAVARVAQVPMMLDESIYGIEEVERTARLGCASYIKFKLMKAGGLEKLVQALERIVELGMQPVLGNGVASDIGCWLEACVASKLITNAGEMNGFQKPQQQLLKNPLLVENGCLVLSAEKPRLDPETLVKVTLEEVSFSGS